MISKDKWQRYIDKLAEIDQHAADLMTAWVNEHGLADNRALIDYAYAVATKYGEASAVLSAEMYDLMAVAQGANVPPADPAETATMEEVAKGMMYGKYHSPSQIPSILGRQVRQAGADTMMQNAIRDQAEWAWVPSGDTCAFCITLASRGWQTASKKVLKGNHAEHIHANCDCTFAIAFNKKGKAEYDAVYDPDKYADMYYGAEGNKPQDRINALRRKKYQQNKDYINAQKRDAYQAEKIDYLSPITDAKIESKNTVTTKSKIIDGTIVANPMDEQKYNNMKSALSKAGITVFEAKGDDLRYLQYMNAEAMYSNGQIMHIGKIPSASAMFEEIIHSTQAQIYGELQNTDLRELYAREIAANRMLLANADSYEFDLIDCSDIENNLRMWENKFEESTGMKYDEADSYYRGIGNINGKNANRRE